MKVLSKFIGFAIAYIAPLIFFIGTNKGIEIVEHDKWICFLFIPPLAFIFTLIVNEGTRDMGKPLSYQEYDNGILKRRINPFWGWFILTFIIQTVMTILYE